MSSKFNTSCVADATRRRFLAVSTTLGLGAGLFPGALLALSAAEAASQTEPGEPSFPKITEAMVEAAATIAGLSLTVEQRSMVLEGLNEQREGIEQVRKMAPA